MKNHATNPPIILVNPVPVFVNIGSAARNVKRRHGWFSRHKIIGTVMAIVALIVVTLGALWADHKMGNSNNPFGPASWSQSNK